ncbi:serine/threonine-protein kinase LMTK1 isoform X1 [Hippocampus zosterae]|uniref:serine/threonine-protein kinase LMTK1 isoform X1 n=1 Tax=Hippocampus zosterae TaxID=109293 RepID=UPI00223E300D|nr:serine/threonine-protein kinase LMTK1 isoform X1 [Hippocampus zosterae]
MFLTLHVTVMSSAFFNPSFAFSSHFDTDGAPLSELSWPSSLAVVVVSFSGLFAFVFLMLACLCCKKGDIGFKEFDNAEAEEYQADLSPSCHNGPEVYILPLTEVSLPVSKQPSRSIQLLKSSALGRHSLLYLKEIGHGWFGKVLLGEVNVGLNTTQVVVKELKASASVQDQMQFLEEVQPYRKLQHPALLQCLAQCSEVTPYLVVMEFCPLGDLKSYLCSCRLSDSDKPDPLILQRMACDVASGLLHLHKNNFIHGDLAMRNILLTSEMSVKIGDYGLSHSLFKEDYYYTQDQIWVPLRWIAPELIDEVHGNLLVVDQTKASNIWSLGVTVWELFELGEQPYRQYSDRQVLTYTVREQQLKLPKPQVQFPLAERWYEVMQFCWLQAELRPSIEEVHLLLTYLCAKGSSEAEEDFEERWNALRPNLLGSPSHIAAPVPLVLMPGLAEAHGPTHAQAVELASSASSSFPLLEHFSDSFHSDMGDDLLTVTETSHGLNFEYKWEQARAEQPYCSLSTSGPLGQVNPHYQDMYYSNNASTSDGCRTETSPPYYEPEHPGVVPVLSAHSPSVSSEYYIRIEEPSECNIHLDDNVVDFGPVLEAGSGRLSPKSQTGSTTAQTNAYWSTADGTKSTAYDSDSSSTVQLTLEPLLRQTSSPVMFSRSHADSSSPQVDNEYYESMCQASPSLSQHSNFGNPVALSENKPSQTPAVSTPSLGLRDPYLEDGSRCEMLHESCHTSVGSLRKTQPIVNRISIDERSTGPLVGHQWARDTDWTSNHSANNNIPHFSNGNRDRMEKYLDLQYNVHCNTTEVWSLTKDTTKTFRSSGTCKEEAERGQPACRDASKLKELGSYIHLCRQDSGTGPEENNLASFQSPNGPIGESARENEKQLLLNGERLHLKPKIIPDTTYIKSPSSCTESCSWIQAPPEKQMWEQGSAGVSTLGNLKLTCPPLDGRRKLISGLGIRDSSATLVELGDYSEEDDDFTDITSSIFTDFNLDYADMQEEELSPLKNPEGTPDSVDTINLSSSMASTCDQAFSPDTFSTPAQPKSLDSGYDTENNGSPEFMFKELVSPQTSTTGLVLQVAVRQNLTSSSEVRFKDVTKKNTYRDSAYFSDYDTENDKSPNEEGGKFFAGPSKHDLYAGKLSSSRDPTKREFITAEVFNQRKNCILTRSSEPNSPHPVSTPGLSMLSPFPVQMGGCLTKGAAPDYDNVELERECQEEPCSELSSSADSEPSRTDQETSTNHQDGSKRPEDCCQVQILCTDSTVSDYDDDEHKENENTDQSTEGEELPAFNHAEAVPDRGDTVRINEDDFEDIDAEECDSQDSLCEASMGAADMSSVSSLLELCGEPVRAPLEEAEDEDDSDDSESDEELRTYNIQEEDSEGSDEDLTVVPMVVSDTDRVRHLRSLLKMPTLLTQSFCEELERKKKAVSFFDDVTVYLFDQESPTGDLVDCSFATEKGCSGKGTMDENTSNVDDSTSNLGENISKVDEGTSNVDDNTYNMGENKREACEPQCDAEETYNAEQGFEWEEDLAFEHCQASPDAAAEPQGKLASPSNSPDVPKSATVALNRFMVSRFSITHVSDTIAATGNTEDCPKD